MKNMKIMLVACCLLYAAPALASDTSVSVEDSSINSRTMKRVSSEEQELLHRQREADDERQLQWRRAGQGPSCWQRSKYFVIGGAAAVATLGLMGVALYFNFLCQDDYDKYNGTGWCKNNPANMTPPMIPPG